VAPAGNASDSSVRVPRAALASVRVFHIASAIDPAIAPPGKVASSSSDEITGYTEWAGEWNGARICIGWDWGVIAGAIIVLHPAQIRSNLQVVMENGDTTSALLTRVYLLEWIEALPWREAAIVELIRSAH
jgi:hypothetical protein